MKIKSRWKINRPFIPALWQHHKVGRHYGSLILSTAVACDKLINLVPHSARD